MKQILLLLFTFSGICMARSQGLKDTVVVGASFDKSEPVKAKASLKILPNPASHKAVLEVRGFRKGAVKLQFLNSKGEITREEQRFLYSGNEEIVIMFSLAPGIYIVLLKQSDTSAKNKLLIQ